jgi:hypothetical protein
VDDFNVAVYLWDGVEELDFAGPYEVLAAWARGSERPVAVRTVGDTADPGGSIDRLAEAGDGIEVDRETRFVDTGDVVTAAGVPAGIDMALHLVARLDSVDQAQLVRRYIQYDPAPPV